MSTRAKAVLITCAAAAALAGCGGGSSASVTAPAVAPARVFSISGFQPAQTIVANVPTTVSFTVRQPDGKPLTRYRTGVGPHTGVHLIIVRNDLAYIIHDHPPIRPGGLLSQSVTFPAPGPYRVLVDVYPNIPGGQPNFQLFRNINVAGAYHPRPLPSFSAVQTRGGYTFSVQGGKPAIHAIQAQFVNIEVRDPHGHPAQFVPWFGALAHAIFFHAGTLDYFHTHVCGSGAANCTSAFGTTRISGSSTAPGRLTLGVLLPVPGTWELFLQMKLGGHVLTVPYTLDVR
jgi:hypothetical protein